MDFATITGFIVGLGLIVTAIIGRVGFAGFMDSFMDAPSIAITLGGTFAATMVNYSFHELVSVFAIAKKVFTQKDEDAIGIIDKIVNLTKKARTESVLAIEQDIKELPNPFLRHGFSLVMANIDVDTIRTELETEITFLQERHKLGQEIFMTMGTFAPAFGMLGTIMGLIMMLAKLEDQSAIAGGMAVALITTLYGALLANLIFLPVLVLYQFIFFISPTSNIHLLFSGK